MSMKRRKKSRKSGQIATTSVRPDAEKLILKFKRLDLDLHQEEVTLPVSLVLSGCGKLK